MHTNDQKYGFLREWMLTFSHNHNYDLEGWFRVGVKAWKLLQEMPDGDDDKNDDLFKYSPKG